MKPSAQDAIAFEALEFAFSGRKAMPISQHLQIQAAGRQAKYANKESPGKRRSRFWRLGPVWARLA